MRNFLLLTTAAVILFASCKKENAVKTTNITNAQAATMVGAALSVNANGFANIKNDIALYAKNVTNAGKGCGVIDSFALARQEASTSTINYNYALGYYYMVNCNNNIQDNLSSTVKYNGSFDAANLTSVNSANATFNLASLSGSDATYSLNGNYQTTGTFQTVDITQLAGNNSLNIDIVNLVINKSSRAIISGTGNVSVSGTVKNKNTFSYNGTIVFKDANTAQLTLEGNNYSINLTTADVTAM
ncbi:hypothetical protein HQ865_07795 [Mucilaginibacter mali]|uniref:Uncharacterized protein n=1 Tax=Mucilaginibacter mali TaxID=2740462 RepID=A0A7D4UCR9_9SPHI|nr:hypothetical protein [Mucilaginibacter mali]QKJ29659.1 hypothetical protein HQ865_07795 [Mucilaginibacter mali]